MMTAGMGPVVAARGSPMGNRAVRAIVRRFCLAAVLVIAVVGPCRGMEARGEGEWSASSAAGLHAALGAMHTAEDRAGVVVANNSIFIDRVALIPTIRLRESVTVAGRRRGTWLQVEARDRPLLRLDPEAAPVLTFVNFTVYLGGGEGTLEEAIGGLVDAPAPTELVFRNTTFAVDARAWVLLRRDILELGAARGEEAAVSVVGSDLRIDEMALGSATLLDVSFRRRRSGEVVPPIVRNVSDAADLLEVLNLAEDPATPAPPVKGVLIKNVSVGEDDLSESGSADIVGKVVLSAPPDTRTTLRVAPIVGPGTLAQVAPTGQLVLLDLMENLTFAIPGDKECGEMDAACMLNVRYHSSVNFDAGACDCSITLINTTILSTCEHVSNLSNTVAVFNADLDTLPEVELAPSRDNRTVRFVSYLGRGTCLANVTLTCDPEVAKESIRGQLPLQGPSPAGSKPSREESAIYILLGVGGGVILVCLVGLIWPPRTFCRNVAARVGMVKGKEGSFVGILSEDDEYDVTGRRAEKSAEKRAAKMSSPGSEQWDIEQYFHEQITGQQRGVSDNAVTIEEQLATGGYGVVYKGRWRGIPVAVKTVVFQDDPMTTGKEKERAILEAAISSSIAHRNVVQTYHHSFKRLQLDEKTEEYGWDIKGNAKEGDWKLYIVQELCEHGSLRSALKKGLFASCTTHKKLLGAVVQVAMDVANGLAHLHHHNVIHGDLNTKNVLLQHETHAEGPLQVVCKLADFGLSVKMGSCESHVSDHRAGTPFYMAPEVAQKGVLSKKSDVFSFGVVMWEIYHQSSPVQSLGEGSLKYHEKFPKYPVTCPMLYALLCVVCLSPRPADRPDFNFVKKVLKTLSVKLQSDDYTQPKNIQKENLAVVSQLNGKNGAELLQLLSDQVELEAKLHGVDLSQPSESPPPTETKLDMQSLLTSKEVSARALLSPKTCISSPTHPPTPSPRPHTPSGSRSPTHGPHSWVSMAQGSEEERRFIGSAVSDAHDSGADELVWSADNEPNGANSYVMSVSIDAPDSEGAGMTFAWDPVVNCEAVGDGAPAGVSIPSGGAGHLQQDAPEREGTGFRFAWDPTFNGEASWDDGPAPVAPPGGSSGYAAHVVASSESISLGISPSPLTPAGDTADVLPSSLWLGGKAADMLSPAFPQPHRHVAVPLAQASGPSTPPTASSTPPLEGVHQPSFVGHRAVPGGQSRYILNWSAAATQPPAPPPPVHGDLQASIQPLGMQVAPSIGPLGVVGIGGNSSREGVGGREQSEMGISAARNAQEVGGVASEGGVLWTMSSFRQQLGELANRHGRLRPGFEPQSSPPSSEHGSSMPFHSIGQGGRRP